MTANHETVSRQCDRIIAGHSLLQHPFYVAWNNGTLPVAALRDYAGQYGSFIAAIGQGWATIGEPLAAREEEEHAKIWERSFAAPLGISVGYSQVGEVAQLVELSRQLFAERSTAIGALYAFESQQPLTAQSKLKGLNDHYSQLPESCGEYFRLHCDGYDELSALVGRLDVMNSAEQEAALSACERMSQALYNALTGIYARHSDSTQSQAVAQGN